MGDPDTVIDWYLAHRLQRHDQVYEAIAQGAATVTDIVEIVYADVDTSLHPLAARSVEAHARLLSDEGRIAWQGDRMVSIPNPHEETRPTS
jgi:hypothetical protein